MTDKPLPTFEEIAKLEAIPYAELETMTHTAIFAELNKRIEELVPFGEYGFSGSFLMTENDESAPIKPWRWLECSAVRGSNEGYYIHIRHCESVPRNGEAVTTLLSVAKTWSWAEALAIAAIATRLLGE